MAAGIKITISQIYPNMVFMFNSGRWNWSQLYILSRVFLSISEDDVLGQTSPIPHSKYSLRVTNIYIYIYIACIDMMHYIHQNMEECRVEVPLQLKTLSCQGSLHSGSQQSIYSAPPILWRCFVQWSFHRWGLNPELNPLDVNWDYWKRPQGFEPRLRTVGDIW